MGSRGLLAGAAVIAGASLVAFLVSQHDRATRPAARVGGLTLTLPSEQIVGALPTANPAPIVQLWYPSTAADQPQNAPAGRWPIVFYFSGWPGATINNRILLDALVTHGFVVVSLTYPARLPAMSEQDYQRHVAEINQPADATTVAALEKTNALFDRWVLARTKDAGLTLDFLERMDASTAPWELRHRLDLAAVGVLGFSLGGSVATHLCAAEPRVKAAINLDSSRWLEGPSARAFCKYLYISEPNVQPGQAPLDSADAAIRIGARLDQQDFARDDATVKRFGAKEIIIPRTTHMDFTDAILQSPLRRRVHRLIDARLMIEMLNALVVAFFDDRLRPGGHEQFDRVKSRYPAAREQTWTDWSADRPPRG